MVYVNYPSGGRRAGEVVAIIEASGSGMSTRAIDRREYSIRFLDGSTQIVAARHLSRYEASPLRGCNRKANRAGTGNSNKRNLEICLDRNQVFKIPNEGNSNDLPLRPPRRPDKYSLGEMTEAARVAEYLFRKDPKLFRGIKKGVTKID